MTGSTATPLRFTFAISSYDHVQDVVDGRVPIEGAEPLFIRLPIPEMFRRFVTSQDWDVSEMSFVQYGTMRMSGDDRLVGIPVFPSRLYRQSAIFVRSDRIETPEDLTGARIGIPSWSNSAGVWARGLLSDMHGIEPSDITWYQGGIERPGRPETVPIRYLSDDVRIVRVTDRGLEEMLWTGDIDGIILPAPPPSLRTSVLSGGLVRLLYDDLETAEREYRRKTGCLPIMHVVAINRALYERDPGIAVRLYAAMETARRAYFERLLDPGVSHVPLPWAADYLGTLGDTPVVDTWPYGVEANRATLETYLRYVRAQGLVAGEVAPEDLFPEWREAVNASRPGVR
jgi:4,5-dihydroxyphthalate decarboxylase